jgi:hypothetical protein
MQFHRNATLQRYIQSLSRLFCTALNCVRRQCIVLNWNLPDSLIRQSTHWRDAVDDTVSDTTLDAIRTRHAPSGNIESVGVVSQRVSRIWRENARGYIINDFIHQTCSNQHLCMEFHIKKLLQARFEHFGKKTTPELCLIFLTLYGCTQHLFFCLLRRKNTFFSWEVHDYNWAKKKKIPPFNCVAYRIAAVGTRLLLR